MQTFLDIVAKDLYKKTGGQFSDTIIVFPNKRASLFFNKALLELTDKPIWSPRYTTISELFRQYSTMETGDRIQLVCNLYLSYIEVTGANEPLDKFYGWGELMLNDFDDIDKHLADTKKVFSLLSNIHELDDVEFLTQQQQQVLQRFFRNFSIEHNTELKKRFLQLWNKFYDIYNNYRHRLKSQGVAYEGMLYRDIIENVIRDNNHSFKNIDKQEYIFIGFNMLHEVETELFSFFQKNSKARFYWDYDAYYLNGHEAGKYIAQHLRRFPNELDAENPTYHNFGKQTEVTFLSSPTEDLQARYIAQWLTPERIAAGRHTAIVLADESLLETVLHCLPPSVSNVNVTTGYPLANSPITSLVRLMMTLLQHKSYSLHNINSILRHPLTGYISPKASELHQHLNDEIIFHPSLADLSIDKEMAHLFTPLTNLKDYNELNHRLLWMIKTIALNNPQDDDFTQEALFRMYSILNRITTLTPSDLSLSLYQGLIQQIIQLTTIPFHGEPIEGIQIMGVLETRNLDFDNLLILSCNEGRLPAKINDASFIPHSIRQGYGLTTRENKVAIYSYYFHRLLQRTDNINILYNSSTSNRHTGEMSSFMLQLIAEGPFRIQRKALIASQDSTLYEPQEKAKTQDIINTLLDRGYFSPSALGAYLRCPMKFFYKYVLGIKDDNDNDKDEMDARAFGNIFHKAAEMLYKPFEGKSINADYINKLLADKRALKLQEIVDNAFRSELFKIKESNRPLPRLNGLQTINREMIITFLRQMLRFDLKHTPFTIIATEYGIYDTISITVDSQPHDIRIGGSIDRLDSYTDGDGVQHIRVIDYKTGRTNKNISIASLEDIFNTDKINDHSDYYLQALMYSGIVCKQQTSPITPNLLYVQQATRDDYSPFLYINKKPILDVSEYLPEYNDNITKLISTILNKDIPFKPTEDHHRCENCIYASFCC